MLKILSYTANNCEILDLTKYLTLDQIEIGKKEVIDFLLKEEYTLTLQVTADNSDNETTHVHAEKSSIPNKMSEQSLWEVYDNSPNMKGNALIEGEMSLQEVLQPFLREPRIQRNVNIYAYWHSSPYQ